MNKKKRGFADYISANVVVVELLFPMSETLVFMVTYGMWGDRIG